MAYLGEATTRPDPATATPSEWRDYLYLKKNPAGWLKENWYCNGCKRFFSLERNTITLEFRQPTLPCSVVRAIDETPQTTAEQRKSET